MQQLIKYCKTDSQRKHIQAIIDYGSQRKAAVALGVCKNTLCDTIKRVKGYAAKAGHSPEHDMVHTVPDGFKVQGVSTLYKQDGTVAQQWVKSSADGARQFELMQEAIKALCDDVERIHPRLPVEYGGIDASDDLMAVYPLGDPHIGLLSWGEECGQDWDLKIAEQKFIGVFDRLVKTAPSCKQAVIINLGDFLHADNMAGVTERSGHNLDLDGRYAKMVSVAMKIIRRMIESALDHHETVRVINCVGNHDDTGALFLSIALANIYENEPRVIIDSSPTPFHYVQFGKVLIGAHHGHSCKADKLPLVMATDKAKEWGETSERVWMVGHIHHDTVKEYPGVKVESFRTLAAKDAYATWNGYRSGQDSKAIVYHREFGEVERHTVNIAMVK